MNGSERFGQVAGRDCTSHPDDCPTPDRTDDCCAVINHVGVAGDPTGGGVIHRDVWPYDIMQYVLAHEIGHYLGLCHVDSDPSMIMYTMEEGQDTEFWDEGLFNYYWSDEPRFTLENAKNTWRFIVDQMEHCLQ
jgi:hypothetical protein